MIHTDSCVKERKMRERRLGTIHHWSLDLRIVKLKYLVYQVGSDRKIAGRVTGNLLDGMEGGNWSNWAKILGMGFAQTYPRI